MRDEDPAPEFLQLDDRVTTNSENIARLSERIQQLILQLSRDQRLAIHQHVDQSWYMQKAEELHLLQSQMDDAWKKLQNVCSRTGSQYREIYGQWRTDLRWIRDKEILPR